MEITITAEVEADDWELVKPELEPDFKEVFPELENVVIKAKVIG